MMRIIITLLAVLFLMSCTNPKSDDVSVRFAESLKPTGELLQRIQLTERRLQSHPFSLEFIVQDVARVPNRDRRFEEYEGDVSGRLLGAWSYAARLLDQRPVMLDSVAEAVLQYQSAEGYFGKNQQPEGWDMWGRQLWGHGRLLVGLVEYYKLTGDKRFLQSAESLGNYIAGGIPFWPIERLSHQWFTNYTSLLESLMILYETSGKEEFLQAAKEIVQYIPPFGHYHSHGYLISLVGLAKLYQQTGEASYWQKLYDLYWRDLMRFGQRPDGAICEWFPIDDRTETCSIVDWLRLNLQMWQISQDGRYLDEAERTWLNGLNFHQTHNGAFGHASLVSCGYTAKYSEAWWCCLEHGLFGLAELLQNCVAATDDGIWINFFTPLQGQIKIADEICSFKIRTSYPQNGDIEFELQDCRTRPFTINIRKPGWAKKYELLVNNEKTVTKLKNGFIGIERTWQSGDVIRLRFPLRLRLEDERGNVLKAGSTEDSMFNAGFFFYGPLLLGADLHWNKQFPDLILFDPAHDYQVKAGSAQGKKSSERAFALPEAHFSLPSKTGRKSTSVMLVPMSEQTGYGTWSDRLPTFIRTGEKPIQRVPVRLCNRVQIVK